MTLMRSILPGAGCLWRGVAFDRGVWLRRRLGHETHLLAIPALAAPAQAFGVDDASASAAAPWIV
jgi:hypothetical protein